MFTEFRRSDFFRPYIYILVNAVASPALCVKEKGKVSIEARGNCVSGREAVL